VSDPQAASHIDDRVWNAWNQLDGAIMRLLCAQLPSLTERSADLDEARKQMASALRIRSRQI
jgi:hypothetical protein